MKAFLVPVARHDRMNAVLETALLAARRFDGVVEGFALTPALAEYVPVDMVGGLTWVGDAEADEAAAKQARDDFAAFMQARGVPRRGGPPGLSFEWLRQAAPGDAFLGHYARLFGATVVGRPGPGEGQPRMTTLEAALFESGRPILIAPPDAPGTLGEVVVIAWNGSSETARTLALGMPFLRKARRVVVVEVEGASVPGPDAAAVSASLAREGIPSESRTAQAGRRSTGETFLAEAVALGCDLLVKGAYTQSRLRQMIFGGATNHTLGAATMPVLMAH